MKKMAKKVMVSAVIVGFAATGAMANDWVGSDTTVYKEYKEGNFNPFGFQEEDSKREFSAYDFQGETGSIVYKEYVMGDFNPYGFGEISAATGGVANGWIVADAGAVVHKEYKEGNFNPYVFQKESEGVSYSAYSFQSEAKNAELYSEYKQGEFNPYAFENQESSARFAEAFAPVRS